MKKDCPKSPFDDNGHGRDQHILEHRITDITRKMDYCDRHY